jgi:Tol biopolymer transport system component
MRARARLAAGVGSVLTVAGLGFVPVAHAADSAQPMYAYSMAGGDVYVAHADGTHSAVVATGTIGAARWSADGSRVYYAAGEDLYGVAPDGSATTLLDNAPALASMLNNSAGWFGFSVDPSGRYFLYSSVGPERVALADGSVPAVDAPVPAAGGDVMNAVVDPANGQLVYFSPATNSIVALNAHGGTTTLVAQVNAADIAVSSDGSSLAYLAWHDTYPDTGYQLDVVALGYSGSGQSEVLTGAAGAPRQLTTDGNVQGQPSWTPDGSRVLATDSGIPLSFPASGGAATRLPLPTGASSISMQPSGPMIDPPSPQFTVPALTAPGSPVPAAPRSTPKATNGLISYMADAALPNSDFRIGEHNGAKAVTFQPWEGQSPLFTGETHLWSADGSQLVYATDVSNYTGAPVRELIESVYPNGAGARVLGTIAPVPTPLLTSTDFVLDATGHFVEFAAGAQGIGVVRLHGSVATPVTYAYGSVPSNAALAIDRRDNQPVVASSEGIEALLPSGLRVRLASVPSAAAKVRLAISPDGDRLAYSYSTAAGRFGPMTVVPLTFSGTGASATIAGIGAPLVTVPAAEISSWTPDGTQVVYTTSGGAYALSVAGGHATKLYVPIGADHVSYQPVSSATPNLTRFGIFGCRRYPYAFNYYLPVGLHGPELAPAVDYGSWCSFPKWGGLTTRAESLTGDGLPTLLNEERGQVFIVGGTLNPAGQFQGQLTVANGWPQYAALVGIGSMNRERTGSLLALDKRGTLWLYPGTGNSTAPFGPIVRVGDGWQTYTKLVDAGDMTGRQSGRLLARDRAGAMWLFQSTGSLTHPFQAPVKVATGWQGYTQIVDVGDLTGDGTTDIVAADAAGRLWMYPITGKPGPAFFGPRVQIGWSGWNDYERLF